MNILSTTASLIGFAVTLIGGAVAGPPTTAEREPLLVYILAGQSNMEGHAEVRVMDYMSEDPATAPLLTAMKDADGRHRKIKDTWISFLTGESGRIDGGNREVYGQLTAGYGSQGGRDYSKPGRKIGPELAFGITLQQHLKRPILIIKTAWGGQSLYNDFRSPSSGPYEFNEANAKRFDTEEKKQKLRDATGRRYRQMVEHVDAVLKDIKRVVPDYDEASGFQLAGFVWFQVFNDMVDRSTYPNRDQPGGFDRYAEWLANLIRDLRKDLDTPELPVVIGVMGVSGPLEIVPDRYRSTHAEFRRAMAAPAKLPEFEGTVAAVQTAPYWDVALAAIDTKREQIRSKAHSLRTKNSNQENADGSMTSEDIQDFMREYERTLFTKEERDLEQRAKSNAGYHYLGSAKTYSQIGQAFANAMLQISKPYHVHDR